MTPTRAQLVWPIRHSFVRYVQSMGGTVTLIDGASHDGRGFIFPGSRVTPGVWEFSGAVVFQAHRGLLEIGLSSPTVVLAENPRLSVATAPDGSRRITLATIEPANAGSHGLRLTVEGAALFGTAYEPGQPLDPFQIEAAAID